MNYQLVVIRGRSASTAVKLLDGVTTAGRQEDCQLRIKSSQVSRKHCELFEKHGMLLVKDLGSSNGTFVNTKKIVGQRVLEPGDELKIGPIVFRVEKIGEPLPAKPAAAGAPAGRKPSDTAVAEAIAGNDEVVVDEDEFEIDFDVDEPAEAESDAIELDDAPAPAPAPKPAPAPAPAPAPKPAAKPAAAKAGPSPKTDQVPTAPPPPEEPGADDAIADFLMGIKMEDDD